jgi:hypothetical protein
MVMKKVSGGDSPLRQGARKSFWTLPILHRRWWRLAVCFLEKSSELRVFSSRKIYTQKGDVRGGPVAHTTWWHGQGVASATLWRGCPLAPFISALDSVSYREK